MVLLMQSSLPLMPEQASTVAWEVDALYLSLVGLTLVISVGIAGTIAYFAVKYRRRSPDELPRPIAGSVKLETVWSVVPFIVSCFIFVWGAALYFEISHPPEGSLDVYVVGKQWMWKFQHLSGQREINELHVPVGRKVKLTMTTEDVIHSFFVPAFRVKSDVVPGRYTYLWFEATKPGTYHLFCAEYCGTSHSGMIGSVVVMEPTDYQAWLAGGRVEGSLSASGQKVFQDLACNTCHRAGGEPAGRGPTLEGLFGKPVELENGQNVIADESYIRESIVNPRAKIHAGYQPIMPTFQGLVSEEQLLQLVEYIRSLGQAEGSGGTTTGAPVPESQRSNPLAPTQPNNIRGGPGGASGGERRGPQGPVRPEENRRPPQ
ncbi:MAG TPA: cytochrome c oxidase subunit II [Blastocatellia bacterium]|nr:cytochrome c oxidase subunit II [Blastocatellia bacterium]